MSLPALLLTLLAPHTLYAPDNVYEVLRNGAPAGEHRLRFAGGEGDAPLTVWAQTRATVSFYGLFDLPFDYDSRAVWQGGALQTISAAYSRGGFAGKAAAGLQAGGGGYVAGGKPAPAPLFPSNHWHIGALTQPRLFNTLANKVSQITVANLGAQTLALANGAKQEAIRRRIGGGINAEVWHSKRGRWLQLRFNVLGANYTFVCRRCAP